MNILTASQVARMLCLTPSQVRRKCQNGEIKHQVHKGMYIFKRSDVQYYIAKRVYKAKGGQS